VKRTLRRTVVAGLLGCAMVLVAAPAANASDSWDRPSQDFGNQNVGSTSDPQTFALVATCDAPSGVPPSPCAFPGSGVHNYGAITTTGPGFAIVPSTDVCTARGGILVTPTYPTSVDTCTLQVTFTPTLGGAVNGTLSTTTSPTGSPVKVALKGIGVATPTTTTAKKCKKKKRSASAAKKCKKKGK
jgi:hypothetical protein